MNVLDKKMYSEVYSVLILLGEEYINKMPKKFFEFIKNNKLDSYSPRYTLNKNLVKQGLQKDSIAMIALINYKYWLENEKDKKEFFSLIKKNSVTDKR